MPTTYKFHCLLLAYLRKSYGFSYVCVLFSKLVAETRNEIIHKHVVSKLKKL